MTNLKNYYNKDVVSEMKETFSYNNVFQVPKIVKVTVNSGLGQAKDSEEILKTAVNDIAKITGQHPKTNKSKKSISGFKLREGQTVGISVTLRGQRMYDFIERLVNIALPRIRDFRGLPAKSFDNRGNYSIGIKEHTIFPEIKFETVKEPMNLQVNITTTAATDEEGGKLLELLGFPFVKTANAQPLKSQGGSQSDNKQSKGE